MIFSQNLPDLQKTGLTNDLHAGKDTEFNFFLPIRKNFIAMFNYLLLLVILIVGVIACDRDKC